MTIFCLNFVFYAIECKIRLENRLAQRNSVLITKYNFANANVCNSINQNYLLQAGQDVSFDCVVDVDPQLRKESNPKIEWFRDGQELEVLSVQLESNETLDAYRYLLYPNATLLIREPSEEDLGTYK